MSRSLVNSATSDDQSLPGGYLLKQLADRTFNSLSDCNDIEGYLRNRLTKRSPDIKYKALLCIKYISGNGADNFKLNFQRDNQIIRECTHFKGVADPLRGDIPNQKVRDMAKETMIAVFATPTARSHSHKMMGMGSTSSNNNNTSSSNNNNYNNNNNNNNNNNEYSQGTYNIPSNRPAKLESGAYSTGNMKGFGNPAFDNSTNNKSFVGKLKDKFGNNNYPKKYQQYEHKGVYQAPATSSYHNNSNNRPQPVQANVDALRKKGQVGGGWNTASVRSSNINNKPPPVHHRQNNNNNDSDNNIRKNVRVSKASSGEYESKLVDDITQPSGVRTLPKPKELKDFINKAKNLDHVLLSSIIQGKFSSNDWRTQLKALCLIESLINNGFKYVSEYFTHELAELVEFENSNIKQIQSKASLILVLLNIKEIDNNTSNEAVNESNNNNNNNILPDLLDETVLHNNNNNNNNSSSLFAELNVKPTSPPSSNNTNNNNNNNNNTNNNNNNNDDDPLASLFSSDNNNTVTTTSTKNNAKDPFGLFGDDNRNDNDPLHSLMNNVNISASPKMNMPSAVSPPKSNSYEEFSSLPLTMEPANNQFGYQKKNITTSSPPKSNIMDFTVQQAPVGSPVTTNLRPANLFDDLTSNRPIVKKETEGFNFVDNDSFAFVQDELRQH